MSPNTPSRLERFKDRFKDKRRFEAINRLVSHIPDSEKDKEGQRTRYRPLFEQEMRRVLKNRDQNGEEVQRRMQEQKASLMEWAQCLDEEYSDKEFTVLIHQSLAPQILGARDSIGEQPFARRTPETYAPYPRLNREALAVTITTLQDIQKSGLTEEYISNYLSLHPSVHRTEAQEWLRKPNFLRLYETNLHTVERIARENAKKTWEGVPHTWQIYEGKKGARQLAEDLVGKGTGWCIAGGASSLQYLSHPRSQMHVCYRGSNAACAIYAVDGSIREIRGSAPGQHMDGDAAESAKAYIQQHFPDTTNLEHAFNDTIMLTDIIDGALERANQTTLLRFLYELDRPIVGFGYGRDPRIKELRATRDTNQDTTTLFGSIAHKPEDITQKTGAYIGPISATLWHKLGALKEVYTSFPDGKLTFRAINLQPTTLKDIRQAFKSNNIVITDYAQGMVDKIPKKELNESGLVDTVTLQVKNLFTTEELKKLGTKLPTTKDIFEEKDSDGKFDKKRIHALGLDVCPATVAVKILTNQFDTIALGSWEYIAMETISGRGGYRSVFSVERYGDGTLGLRSHWTGPGSEWFLDDRFVFRLRK